MIQNIDLEIEKLNSGQKQAVKTIQGPVLVIAGPGTGKTQVLSYRIANILNKTDASANNILCLTFTETGASEMRNRLFKLIGKEAFYVKIHTFHSFCNEVIQSNGELFSFSKNLNQLDDLNRIKIVRGILDSLIEEKGKEFSLFNFSDKYFYARDIQKQIQALKREGVLPDQLLSLAMAKLAELNANPRLNKKTLKPTVDWTKEVNLTQKNIDLAIAYKKYQEALEEQGFYDYEDMILFVIEKLNSNANLLADLQEQYQYILVDEYQDTNGSQNKILQLITSYDGSPNIFAVGDDDQAIFRFQGANVENLLFFEKQFKNVNIVTLNQNYRSSQLILDAANSLIDNNQQRLSKIIPDVNKVLKSGLEIPNRKIDLMEFNNQEEEINFVIKKIQELLNSGVSANEIAIFYKEHKDAVNIAMDLVNNNIPIKLEVGKNSLDQKSIIQFLDLLKAIKFNVEDRGFLLFKLINYPFFNIPKLDCFKLSRISYDTKVDLFDLMQNQEILEKNQFSNVADILNLANKIIEWSSDKFNYSFLNFVKKVMDESNFLNYYFSKGSIEDINAIQSFFEYIKTLNNINPNLDLEQFLRDLTLMEDNKISIKESEISINRVGINLMTAHKSKGLQFKHVFIIACIDKKWGNKSSKENLKLIPEIYSQATGIKLPDTKEDKLEEERRLFFVALTRAQEKIYISYAKEYPTESGTTNSVASIFINEIDSKFIENHKLVENSLDKTISLNKLKFNNNSVYSVTESEYLNSIISRLSISASSLNKYIDCPIRFKFEDILRIPQAANKHTAIGSAIHYALEKFFREKIAGVNKDLNFILEKFLYSLSLQFLNKEDYNLILEEGKEILTNYYNYYNISFNTPADVEYSFSGKKLFLELGEGIDPIMVTGKIDKIEWINKEKGSVRVVDYKTSKPVSQDIILGLNKNPNKDILRQLTFYKLLGDLDHSFINLNSRIKYKIEECQIDFLKTKDNKTFAKESIIIEQEQVAELKNTIKDVVSKIRSLEFGSEQYPPCGKCKYCLMVDSQV